LGLQAEYKLEITSGQSSVHLAEIIPWLASFDKVPEITKYYGGGRSIATLPVVKLEGPLFSPAKWHFNFSGDVKDLVLKDMPGRPGPLKIASAKFKADPQTLQYTDGQVSLLDSVWTVSGAHQNYFKGFDNDLRLKFEARLEPKSVQWLSEVLTCPGRYTFGR
jgi:hypothetical protein